MAVYLASYPGGTRQKNQALIGSGTRPPVFAWRKSRHSGKQHKVFIPQESTNKELVLVVGDSHLRSFVEGDVVIRPHGPYGFGFSSSLGATAHELELEVQQLHVDRQVSLCVVLATGNDTDKKTLTQAGQDFERLLSTVLRRWKKACVVDFPTCHTVSEAVQNQFRQEYRRLAEANGLRYVSCADKFPMDNLGLWVRDGVHLSVPEGVQVLADLICKAVKDEVVNTRAPTSCPGEVTAAPSKPSTEFPDLVPICPPPKAVQSPAPSHEGGVSVGHDSKMHEKSS
ncbi:uncharacterized protein LOC115435841 [Sphaeramia orbicularis]|uniref:uncharacterized protein LOC115435841 n=1 Tax=Sphaeramia orbicularis TaxID=375764 RepID=UPI00117FA695|nr:uncharacterized protein LOC115435841 [Sphaeramia orbicularis]